MTRRLHCPTCDQVVDSVAVAVGRRKCPACGHEFPSTLRLLDYPGPVAPDYAAEVVDIILNDPDLGTVFVDANNRRWQLLITAHGLELIPHFKDAKTL